MNANRDERTVRAPKTSLGAGSEPGLENNHAGREAKEAIASEFAASLASLLDATNIFCRKEWAEFLGVTESAISQWLNDKTLPRPELLRKILRFLRDSDDVSQEPLRRFEAVCALPAKHVCGRRLGGDYTFDQYMLRPLRAALQRNLGALPAAQQEQVLLAANETARNALAGVAPGSQDAIPLLEMLQAATAEACPRLGAASICFYVADPLFEDDFRLALNTGLRYPEPLQGPRFPLKTMALSRLEEDHCFFKDARSARSLREESGDPEVRALIAKNPLFGDFVEREEVRSCARIQLVEDERLACVLFVNYAQPQDFSPPIKEEILAFFSDLADALPALTAHYRTEVWVEELRTLPIALQRFLAENREKGREALARGLEVIIHRILDASGLDPKDTLGTIHIFERETGLLRPAAQVGPKELEGKVPTLLINDGEGLIAWAALRRRAIMVNDLQKSAFGKIYRPISKETRSEFAIPMFAGAEIVAVLNLESVHCNAFSERIVRPLAWAASQMAVVWQNFMWRKYHAILEGLIEALDRDVNRSLSAIARLAAQHLEFGRCDIWRYDSEHDKFTGVGANYRAVERDSRPRPGGWSHHVAKRRRPVFISNIESRSDFTAMEWTGKCWTAAPPDSPLELNHKSFELGVRAELGFPLIAGSACVGVLWMKFDQEGPGQALPPTPIFVRTIEVFARRASPVVQAAEPEKKPDHERAA